MADKYRPPAHDDTLPAHASPELYSWLQPAIRYLLEERGDRATYHAGNYTSTHGDGAYSTHQGLMIFFRDTVFAELWDSWEHFRKAENKEHPLVIQAFLEQFRAMGRSQAAEHRDAFLEMIHALDIPDIERAVRPYDKHYPPDNPVADHIRRLTLDQRIIFDAHYADVLRDMVRHIFIPRLHAALDEAGLPHNIDAMVAPADEPNAGKPMPVSGIYTLPALQFPNHTIAKIAAILIAADADLALDTLLDFPVHTSVNTRTEQGGESTIFQIIKPATEGLLRLFPLSARIAERWQADDMTLSAVQDGNLLESVRQSLATTLDQGTEVSMCG